MCGIAGIYTSLDGAQDQHFEKMLKTLHHRGPDASGVFHDGPMHLLHSRLSIIDLSNNANQPMVSSCGRFVIVYNGEIYNFKEIKQQIIHYNPGIRFQTQSDTEVLLEAFRCWNVECVHKLNGMFAFAVWDKKEEKLFLLRDRMGIKPLFCVNVNGIFGFASEIKALTAHPSIRKHLTINHQAINQFLHLGYVPARQSVYQQIQKFPQGSYGVFQNEQLSIHRYWNLASFTGETRIEDPQEALYELEQLLLSSLQYRLVADVPFGTFLSGGIDSGLVTAMAQKLTSKPINTFTIGFWEQQYNEAPYAAEIARFLGTRHHEFKVSEKDALDLMPQLTQIYDEPFADSSSIPTLLVSQMARKHVIMTLSGDGGDELFMGYGAYRWAYRLQNTLIRSVSPLLAKLVKYGPAKYRRAYQLFHYPGFRKSPAHIFSQEQYLFSEKEIHRILHADYIQEMRLNTVYPSYLDAAERQAFFDLCYYLPDDLLVKVDRASMHFSLETRVPFLDHRLVEWAVNLHPGLKIKGKTTKYLLKKLLFSYIPQKYFDRPKKGFAIPLQKWMKKELKPFVLDYLNQDSQQKHGIFETAVVQKLISKFYDVNNDYLYNRIWSLVVLQKWMEENW
ncbi:MAG: asparagine synthase (glutamine-hydrolyzing) [Bacteroidota bacterium]